jgi:hypothetical protein
LELLHVDLFGPTSHASLGEETLFGDCWWLFKIYMGLFLQVEEWDSTNIHRLRHRSAMTTQCSYIGNKKWQRLRVQEIHS